MGPTLRTRTVEINQRSKTSGKQILADTTNKGMTTRSKRTHNQKLDNKLRDGVQKSCIYKPDGIKQNPDFKPEEGLAIYNFEIDENDPQPRKVKRKRKVYHKKKLNLLDTMDEENKSTVVRKPLRSRTLEKGKTEFTTKLPLKSRSIAEELNIPDEKKHQGTGTLLKHTSSFSEKQLLKSKAVAKELSSFTGKKQLKSRSQVKDRYYPTENKQLKPTVSVREITSATQNKQLKFAPPLIVINCPEEKQQKTMTPMIVINCPAENEPIRFMSPIVEINSPTKENQVKSPFIEINSPTAKQLKSVAPVIQLNSPTEKQFIQLNSPTENIELRDVKRPTEGKLLKSPTSNQERGEITSESRRIRSRREKNRILENKENIPCHKPETFMDLTEDTELNFSLGESQPIANNKHQDSICSTFSPGVESRRLTQTGAFVTVRKPDRLKPRVTPEDFSVSNFFGFDEDSEDDLQLLLSPVKLTTEVKPTMSIPFAVSSTPNLKPSIIRTASRPARLELNAQISPPSSASSVNVLSPVLAVSSTETFSTSLAASSNSTLPLVSTLASTITSSVSSMSAVPSIEPTSSAPAVPSILASASTITQHSVPPVSELFLDDDLQHFTKPPRKSYDRQVRKRRESHSEYENWSDDEAISKKQSKLRKKPKIKKEKTVDKWAANLSAQFEEIDSFELYVE